jgi:hypothetical protein
MNENKIQLGKFLKKENWEFHFALSEDPKYNWLVCFQRVCEESQLDAKIILPGCADEPGKKNQYFAVIVGGLINDSESQLRQQLEKAINKTNEIQNDPVIAEYWSVRRKIADTTPVPPYIKTQLESRHKELENKLRETGKYKYVAETDSTCVEGGVEPK